MAVDNQILADGLERVSDAARFLNVSRSLVYKLMRVGILPFVKIGHAHRIPVRAVRELVASNLTQFSQVGQGEERRSHP